MYTLIIQRHGKREIETGEASGDGPLKYVGISAVRVNAEAIAYELKRKKITAIDRAVVSGSIRCAQSFAETWTVLLSHKIKILRNDMDRRYFGTPFEDGRWEKMYAEHGRALRAEIERVGEKAAVMSYAGRLVTACVKRTVDGIRCAHISGDKVVLVATHAPHDVFIEAAFTGHERGYCLGLGQYSIVQYAEFR